MIGLVEDTVVIGIMVHLADTRPEATTTGVLLLATQDKAGVTTDHAVHHRQQTATLCHPVPTCLAVVHRRLGMTDQEVVHQMSTFRHTLAPTGHPHVAVVTMGIMTLTRLHRAIAQPTVIQMLQAVVEETNGHPTAVQRLLVVDEDTIETSALIATRMRHVETTDTVTTAEAIAVTTVSSGVHAVGALCEIEIEMEGRVRMT